jgi:hypothetical protein
MQIGHLLPISSLAGAQTVGPDAKPRTYKVTPRMATSVLIWKWGPTSTTAEEKMALAKEDTNVV